MSWSVNFGSVEADDIKTVLMDASNLESVREQQPAAPDEAERAYRAGARAAIDFMKGNAIGGKPVKGYISGHANPGNEKPEGFSTDFLTVHIEQA